jgi:hypothetical protein
MIVLELKDLDILSPFAGLHLDRELVCEFFAVFSRFEFSLKETGNCREIRGLVEPAWWGYAEKVAELVTVEPGSPLEEAISYLCDEPPLFQLSAHRWGHRALHGICRFEQAIDAAKQVRNNLFHGGKHTQHSPSGRDNRLVKSSLTILYACLEADAEIRDVYIQNQF